MRYVLAVLAACGFAAQSQALRDEWTAVYPKHAMAEYEEDLEPLAVALLGGPYPPLGGVGLAELHGFTAKNQAQAEKDAKALLKGHAPQSVHVHELLAAARLAFAADPAKYDREVEDRVARKIQDNMVAGTRNSPGSAGSLEAVALEPKDAADGVSAEDVLFAAHVKAGTSVGGA